MRLIIILSFLMGALTPPCLIGWGVDGATWFTVPTTAFLITGLFILREVAGSWRKVPDFIVNDPAASGSAITTGHDWNARKGRFQ